MPQAPSHLQAEFDDDAAAFAVLGDRVGVTRGGLIYPKPLDYKPTPAEFRAIDYLILEWDYGFTIKPEDTE